MISDENRKRVIEKMSAYLVERLMSEKNLSRDIAGETLKKSLLYEMAMLLSAAPRMRCCLSLWAQPQPFLTAKP
jgi:hypothetical protein